MYSIMTNLAPEVVAIAFEFMLSIIVTFLTRNKFIRWRYTNSANWQVDETVDSLVGFCLHGWDAPGIPGGRRQVVG